MKIINSPIVITILVIVSAFVLRSQSKPILASEIQGAYDALISIAEEAGSDAEKTKAIQDFAEQVASQLRVGFTNGFSREDEESREQKFLRVKKNVRVTDVREIQSEWSGRQTTMFKVENNSEYPLTQLKVNIEYYKNGELIDVKNEHLHGITVLDSGDSFTSKKDRSAPNHLSEEEKDNFSFDETKVFITAFNIAE